MATIDDLEAQFTGTSSAGFKDNNPATIASGRVNYIASDVKMYKPPLDSTQHVRFIPIPNAGYFAYPVRAHFGLGFENNSIACPTMNGERCPVCEESKRQFTAGNKDLGKAFKFSVYSLIYIIDRNNEALGPQVFAISGKKALEAIRELLVHPITGAITSFDHPKTGHDLFFSKRDHGLKIEGRPIMELGGFKLNPDGPTPLHVDQKKMLTWLKFVVEHPLNALPVFVSAEKMIDLAGLGEDSVAETSNFTEEETEVGTKSVDLFPDTSSDEFELATLEAELAALETEEVAAPVPVEEKVLTRTVPAATTATTVTSLKDRIAAKVKKSV